MSIIDKSKLVGQLVADKPGLAKVFDSFGIDYCCGGKVPLEQACAKKNINIEHLLNALLAYDTYEKNWGKATFKEITDYIKTTFHEPLRLEIARISALAGKVLDAHGKRHPELEQLVKAFHEFRTALELHMQKEDVVLFPMACQFDGVEKLPKLHCVSINNPITVMLIEHEEAGDLLQQFRYITNDYVPPEDACTSYVALYHGLKELETSMHLHVHLENNILFPRLVQAEEKLRARRAS